MGLLRVWRAHLLGGAAAAIVTPALILVAALAVGLSGGGLHGLGALGQALTGPAVPTMEPSAGIREGQDPRRLLERSLPPPAPGSGPVEPGGAGGTPAGGPGGGPNGGGPAPGPPDGGPSDPGSPTPPSRPEPEPPAPEPPEPEPTPGPIRQVGEQVKEVTDQVPIAGEPVGRIVDLLVETVESLPLPPPPQ